MRQQYFNFFGTTAKNKRVTAFESYYLFALLG